MASSGEARSLRGHDLEYIGRFLSLVSSNFMRLACHVNCAMVSQKLIAGGNLLDDAHQVRYLGLGLTILRKSRHFNILHTILQNISLRAHACSHTIFFHKDCPFSTMFVPSETAGFFCKEMTERTPGAADTLHLPATTCNHRAPLGLPNIRKMILHVAMVRPQRRIPNPVRAFRVLRPF